MTQKVCTDPYVRAASLVPHVRAQAFKNGMMEDFLSGAGGKSYQELFQELLVHLRTQMESAFSEDLQLQQLQDKLVAHGETIEMLAESHSISDKSMTYIEQKLKDAGYSPPPITKHDWCTLC